MQNRRRFIRQLLAAAGFALALPTLSLAQTAGKDYVVVEPPQATDSPGKIEVLEFFSYGCPHCNDLHPVISAWAAKLPADVQFRRAPVSFGRAAWANLSRLYYTLEASGDLGKLDNAVFQALHAERVNLFEESAIVAWIEKKGGDSKRFADTFSSFGIMSKAKRADQMATTYRIPGVPTLIIDGKYLISGKEHKEMLAIADQLIAKIRAERGKK
ncbi:MAG TPA: thiol:disulfide interchange protein DsbA/DsbL [Rhodocyclaceae bacterium]|nr:thiol:disulfide interchange protein DsbA/DsbL [Rhodocyclaceae bacterium]